MFRKIILSYFPDEAKNSLSPIKFHLKLLIPKLFYGISLKYGIENYRVVNADTSFSFFDDHSLFFDSLYKENFYYGYKNFALMNGYNNYNLYSILPAVSLICINSYKNNPYFFKFLKEILFSINYLLLMFYSRFKQYEQNDKKSRFDFMITLLEKIIYHLEYTKSKKKNTKLIETKIKTIISLLKENTDFLMLLFNTTEFLSSIFENKKSTDLNLYEYLVSAAVLDFPDEGEIKKILKKQIKNIFLKRYTYYIDMDTITMLNMIGSENVFLSYLNKDNLDYIENYFANSLSYLDKINLSDSLKSILDKVYDFKDFSVLFVDSLKDYNSANIDFTIDTTIGLEKLKQMLSKEMMDSVKKVSNINEQFIDLFIYLISNFNNNNFSGYENFNFIKNLPLSEIRVNKDLLLVYKFLDTNYFINSYYYKHKKVLKKTISYYDFGNKFLSEQLYRTTVSILFNDFQQKTHIEYIDNKTYTNIFKQYFSEDIKKLLKGDITKMYLNKYFKNIGFHPTESQLINFKNNIYYPDFMVYYQFLKIYNKSIYKKDFITMSRLKETLFGYLILRAINGYDENIEKLYLEAVGLYSIIGLNLESIFKYFETNYFGFINFFARTKQNKQFVNIVVNHLSKNKIKHIYIYDACRSINYYNKRLFTI